MSTFANLNLQGIPPEQAGKSGWGKGKSGRPCFGCCLRNPIPDKRKKMDGWMDVCAELTHTHTQNDVIR